MSRQSQWLFEALFPSEVTRYYAHPTSRYEQVLAFEVPYAFRASPDYSEGTGRKKSAKRINPKSVDVYDIQRGSVEPIRKPRPKPPRGVIPSQQYVNQSQALIDPQEAARKKANQQGAALVRHFISQLEKSNPSGTAVRARARLRAGAEMIRRANKLRDPLLVNVYRTVGQQLIDRGNADMHPSKS